MCPKHYCIVVSVLIFHIELLYILSSVGCVQVLRSLSSSMETLLQDLYSAREERRKVEGTISQVCAEREQLQARVRDAEVMEQRLEVLESEVSPYLCEWCYSTTYILYSVSDGIPAYIRTYVCTT